jgi:hypothetical protein
LIGDWIGFSEHWEIAPLAEGPSPVVVTLQADVAKQEAVVHAFRVRVSFVHFLAEAGAYAALHTYH